MLTDCRDHRLREEKGVTDVQKCPPGMTPKFSWQNLRIYKPETEQVVDG